MPTLPGNRPVGMVATMRWLAVLMATTESEFMSAT
jgi:hypothetical protein